MSDIQPGHLYTDGEFVNGPSLTEHVANAIILPAFISGKSLKSGGMAVADEIIFRDAAGDAINKATFQNLIDMVVTPGSVLQTQYSEYLANSNLTAIIPTDDTIPQNTEGTQIISATITPALTTSRILVRFQGFLSANSAPVGCNAALFRDAGIPALCATTITEDINDNRKIIFFEYLDSPSSTSALTYKVRVGPGTAGTIRMNGLTTGRLFGGVARTTITLQEIK